MLSDSDSNDADEFNKRVLQPKDKAPEMMDIAELANENDDSELFDLASNALLKDQVVEETLSQLPKVDLGDDFDWEEIVGKSNKLNDKKTENSEITPEKITVTDVAWSKGQVSGLQVKNF